MEQVTKKYNEVVEKALFLYGLDLSKVKSGTNLKGCVAGWARKRGNQYSVKFNHDMIVRGGDSLRTMIEDTIPHELAHIVCFMNPKLGNNHDSGWRQVCIALGGTGDRTHGVEVVYGRGNTYEYTTDKGHKVRLGERHHAAIQHRGHTVRMRHNKGSIHAACGYSIVGTAGRTLATPVVVKPSNHPDVVETAVNVAVPVQAPVNTSPLRVVQRPTTTVQATPQPGESKAAVSRRIMLTGYRNGDSYETIIAAMMQVNGYTRQLARGTFKANAARVDIPESFQ
jgi:predicted SprT family Zn-dependent metalloprotease